MRETLTVAVVMGGPSAEHAISLKSGQGVLEALRRRHWDAVPIVIPGSLAGEEAAAMTAKALRDCGAEAVFIALHGTFGEDGTIQQLCEDLQLAYTGSDVSASRLGMDKVASRRRFVNAGLAVPRSQVVEAMASPPTIRGLSYPFVVKPTAQGSSVGVSIVQRPDALPQALAIASRYGSQVLVEEFVAGRELTVGVLGDEPLPVVEIRPQTPLFNYEAKYTAGLTEYRVPAPLPPDVTAKVQRAALTAHHALGCRHVSRTDLILSLEGIPVILEVNTIPGLTPTSLLPKAAACVNLPYDELCEQLVLMAGSAPRLPPPLGFAPRNRRAISGTQSRKCFAFHGAKRSRGGRSGCRPKRVEGSSRACPMGSTVPAR